MDKFISTKEVSTKELSKKLNFSIEANEKYLVLIQHSIINQVDEQEQHIKETLDAIVASGYKCFINFPNSDAGHFAIIEAYRSYAKKYNQLKLFQNLDRNTYINLLRNAACLLGNSSSGILEAPSIKLPAINIGLRQRGRMHGNNVLFVENNKTQILRALDKAINDKNFIENLQNSTNPYGDGETSEKVVKVLATIKLDGNLIYKNITY